MAATMKEYYIEEIRRNMLAVARRNGRVFLKGWDTELAKLRRMSQRQLADLALDWQRRGEYA